MHTNRLYTFTQPNGCWCVLCTFLRFHPQWPQITNLLLSPFRHTLTLWASQQPQTGHWSINHVQIGFSHFLNYNCLADVRPWLCFLRLMESAKTRLEWQLLAAKGRKKADPLSPTFGTLTVAMGPRSFIFLLLCLKQYCGGWAVMHLLFMSRLCTGSS